MAQRAFVASAIERDLVFPTLLCPIRHLIVPGLGAPTDYSPDPFVLG